MARRRTVSAEPPRSRVTMAAFDRAMFDDEAEAALFAIAGVPYLDDEDDDGGEERVLTEADMARMEAEIESRPGGWAKVYDEAAAAAVAPLPDFELTDDQCHRVAALLLSVPLIDLDEL